MNTREALTAARSKIERPSNWTRGVCARNSDGVLTGAEEPDAVCWCAVGALWAVTVFDPYEAIDELTLHLPRGFREIAKFNDALTTTHADVLALFDRAIAACKEE